MDNKRYAELSEEEIAKRFALTQAEKITVAALLVAVRALPKTICLAIDDEDGLTVSKRITKGYAKRVACVRKKSLKF